MLVSGAVILLCLVILLGMTFALFTDTREVVNHLQAGSLQVTLKRTALEKTDLGDDGLLKTVTDKNTVNFTASTTDDVNVFGILQTDRIVPGCKYTATMQIENHGDVAFNYLVKVVCSDSKNGENLAKQLWVTMESNGYKAEGSVHDGVNLENGENGYFGLVKVGEKTSFTVSVEFLDSLVTDGIGDNNAAKNQTVDFDLIVYAVQALKAPR